MGFYYELFPCMTSLTKEVLGLSSFKNDHENLSNILVSLFSILLVVIMLALLVPWVLLNYLIRGYLALTHGSNYGGLLDMDTLFEHTDPKILLNTVYIVEHSGRKEEFYQNIKSACKRLLHSHSKFSSTVNKCLGFYYYLSNQVSLEDIVSSVDYEEDHITRDELLKILEMHYLSLSNSDGKLWDVKVFNKPIIWGDLTKTYYPVLIRTNHCIADGICLSVFHQNHLMSDVVKTQFENAVRKANKSTNFSETASVLNLLVVGRKLDYSNLNCDEDTPGKIAMFVEDEAKYFRIIKDLRMHFKVTFTDVIATAAISSLKDYLNEHNIDVGCVLYGNTTRSVSENSSAILSGHVLRNEASLIIAEIPCRSSASESLTNRLKAVAKVLENKRNSADRQCIYLLQKVAAFLPPSILGRILHICSTGSSLGITNIPAPTFATIQGSPVKDVIIFPSRFANTKFLMTIHSYGGRFQVILLSKNGLITAREDLQKILDATFKNIETLWEENKDAIQKIHNN